MKPVSVALGNKRLLQLAAILENVPSAEMKTGPAGEEVHGYDQGLILHACGSPACAWGHWLLTNKARKRRIIRQALEIEPSHVTYAYLHKGPHKGETAHYVRIVYAQHEFGITSVQTERLFSGSGCGNARTGIEAAAFIRRFVAGRQS